MFWKKMGFMEEATSLQLFSLYVLLTIQAA